MQVVDQALLRFGCAHQVWRQFADNSLREHAVQLVVEIVFERRWLGPGVAARVMLQIVAHDVDDKRWDVKTVFLAVDVIAQEQGVFHEGGIVVLRKRFAADAVMSFGCVGGYG